MALNLSRIDLLKAQSIAMHYPEMMREKFELNINGERWVQGCPECGGSDIKPLKQVCVIRKEEGKEAFFFICNDCKGPVHPAAIKQNKDKIDKDM